MGVGGQRHAPAALSPGKKNPVIIVQEARWAPGSVWAGAVHFASLGFDPRSVQPVASRYIDHALYLSVHFTKQSSSAFWAVIYDCDKLLIQLYQDNGINQQHELCGYPENCTRFMHEVLTLILRRSRTGTVWFYTSTSNKRAARQNCTQSH